MLMTLLLGSVGAGYRRRSCVGAFHIDSYFIIILENGKQPLTPPSYQITERNGAYITVIYIEVDVLITLPALNNKHVDLTV